MSLLPAFVVEPFAIGRFKSVVEVDLVGVKVDAPSSMMLLREKTGVRRVLPIMIGPAEATAIQFALNQVPMPRPMTHDLLKNVLDALGCVLEQVVVSELSERTFYAELRLRGSTGPLTISARPSDAVALAVRTGTPIFVAENVLAEAGIVEDDKPPADADEMVAQFRQFIDNVDPDDFAS